MRSLLVMVLMLVGCSLALAEPVGAGIYKGKWEGSSASGDFRIVLAKGAEGQWTGDVVFGLSGQDVKCKVTTVQVSRAKLKMVYSFDLQGNALESMIDGEFDGQKLSGKYRTQIPGDGTTVDEGTWSTTAEK